MFKNPLGKSDPEPSIQAPSIPKDMEVTPRHVPKNPQKFRDAIKKAKELIEEGSTKVAAVRQIYPLLEGETSEVMLLAFKEGCDLTAKGAVVVSP